MFSFVSNQIEKLKLPLMSRTNKSRMQTALPISIEARKGISTEYQPMIEQKQSK